MLNNSDAWISCGFICLSGKNSIVYEACVSAKTSMGSAAPTQQGAGGGGSATDGHTHVPVRFLSCGLVRSRVPAPLPLGSGLPGVPLAWRRRPQPTHGTAARGAGRAVRGARRACRLLSRLYFPPPRGVPGCGPRGGVCASRVSQSAMKLFKCHRPALNYRPTAHTT